MRSKSQKIMNPTMESTELISRLTFTNPRMLQIVSDWPIAGRQGLCRFRIVRNSEGQERGEKQVENGRLRFSPWIGCARVVTGPDSLTYVVGMSNHKATAFTMNHRMRKPIFYAYDHPQFEEIRKVLECVPEKQ